MLYCALSGRRLLERINADELSTTALVLEFDDTVNQREKRVVLATPDVLAGFPLGAPLTRQYVAAYNSFATKLFQPQPLSRRVASVT